MLVKVLLAGMWTYAVLVDWFDDDTITARVDEDLGVRAFPIGEWALPW